MVRQVPDDVFTGNVTIPGFPIKYSEISTLPELSTSSLGQDNASILKTRLGYSDAQVQSLVEKGVLDWKQVG